MGQERTRQARLSRRQRKDPSCFQKAFFKMPSAQWEIFPSIPAWERSVKHNLSFLSSHCGLIFTGVKAEDNQPWWSLCFGICSQVDLCGFSRTCLAQTLTNTSLRKGAEVTSSAASPYKYCSWSKDNLPNLQPHHERLPGRAFSGEQASAWHLADEVWGTREVTQDYRATCWQSQVSAAIPNTRLLTISKPAFLFCLVTVKGKETFVQTL